MTISRVAATLSYPARVTLVCSMNLVPAATGDRRRVCRCTPGQIERYQGRISGPLLDRMDLFVDVPRLTRQELREERHSEESRFVRERVSAARGPGLAPGTPNSALSGRRLREACALGGDAETLFSRAVDRMGLSGGDTTGYSGGKDRRRPLGRGRDSRQSACRGTQLPEVAPSWKMMTAQSTCFSRSCRLG